jgi:hypothetical protein
VQKKIATRGAASIATLMLAACVAASKEDALAAAHAYGWSHTIATYNTLLPVNEALGHASDTIAGHSLREIVNRADVRVRGDDHACVDCHAWAANISRSEFCDDHVSAFLALPTQTGKDDPPNAKPAILKELIAGWRARGCPD